MTLDAPIGRDDLLAELREVTRAAVGGSGRALVLVGETGIGRTTLLDRAAADALADGASVLAVRGHADEQTLHRTVLRDLASATGDAELAAVVGSAADGELPARFAAGLLSLPGPCVVIVDDLDHVDDVSATTLRYLARRVTRSPVSLLASCSVPLVAGDIRQLAVRGLDEVALGAVLRCEPELADVHDDVVRSLHRLTGGNPLVALEIAAQLPRSQREGTEPLPTFPPLGSAVVRAIAAGTLELPAATRHALVLAAAEPSGDLGALTRAAALLDVSLDALAPAEEAGVVVLADGFVRFDRPICRLALYQSVAPASRRAAHRALAAAHDGPADAERRALHLALGAVEPVERVAADIELAALAAERRGDLSAARRWWQHAARLSPSRVDADARARRARLASEPAHGPLAALTEAERRVAEVVGGGATNKAAANGLGVSVKTVDTHLQSIYRKLGIGSRSELAGVIARRAAARSEEVAP